MINARQYQLETIDKVREQMMLGFKAILIVLPTGGGKTVCAAHLMASALSKGSKLLFCAHRRELISQTYSKMIDMGVPENDLGIIMGDGKIQLKGRVVRAHRPRANIQIASIDTLRHRYMPDADIIFVDEAHRCLAKSYLSLKTRYPEGYHLGLTATPFRAGNKGLGPYYHSLVVGATPSMLIGEGWIGQARVWTVPPDELPDLTAVKTRAGDYAENELAEACNKHHLVGSIVEHWKKYAGRRRTVCFPVNVEHSKHIVADFVAAGIPAEHLDGNTPTDERDEILTRLERGEILIISSVGVLCEGWDMPSVKCAILARPTKSTGLYLQQAGRILRPYVDPITGESIQAIILDHAGCVMEHGLPSEDREFSLEDIKKRRKGDKSDTPSTRTCPGCFAIFGIDVTVCPECGHAFSPKERKIEHIEGDLREYTQEGQNEKRAYWDSLCVISTNRNYKITWAAHKFKEKYGHWPPKSFPRPGGRPMTPGELDVFRAKLTRIAQERGFPIAWVEKRVNEQVKNTSTKPQVIQPEPQNLILFNETSPKVEEAKCSPSIMDEQKEANLLSSHNVEIVPWSI